MHLGGIYLVALQHVLHQRGAGLDDEFEVRSGARSNLETDLVISEDGNALEHRGKGQQCFIKTSFALKTRRAQAGWGVAMWLKRPYTDCAPAY